MNRRGGGFGPVPGQQIIKALGWLARDAGQHIGQPGLRVDIVHLGRLCRTPNYAERRSYSQRYQR